MVTSLLRVTLMLKWLAGVVSNHTVLLERYFNGSSRKQTDFQEPGRWSHGTYRETVPGGGNTSVKSKGDGQYYSLFDRFYNAAAS